MNIAMFHTKRDNSKTSRNKTSHEPISKLTRLFSKLNNTAIPNHQHGYPYKHALARTCMTDITPFTKSGAQIPVVNHDKDKLFEQRHYQARQQATYDNNSDNDNDNDNDNVDNRNHTNDKDLFESNQSEEGIPGCSLLNQKDSNMDNGSPSNNLIYRPSLTPSLSLNEIARYQQPHRPSHINSNHKPNHLTYNLTRHSTEIVSNRSTISTDIKCHDNDTSYDSGLYSNEDNGDKNGTLMDSSHVKQQRNKLQIWDSAFWNQSSPLSSSLSLSSSPSSSSPSPGRPFESIPPVLHELRRINTISNDNLEKPSHYHSLRRNQSYVVKKGRFEISIETSGTINTR